jgi:salicylate hydroxylase
MAQLPERDAVLIAGGGIGGLALALALARKGIPSRVLERRPAFAEEGAGIQIGPNGTRVLQDIGAAGALHHAAAVPDGLQVRCALNAHPLTRLPFGSWIAGRHGAPYWTAHRQDLHAALLETARSDPLITLQTGAGVESAEQTASSVKAHLTDGTTLAGSVLVAADGLWSALRTQIFDGATPRPAGKSAYRTVVAASHLPEGLATNDVHIWLTEGAHVVHYPVRAGAEHAFVVIFDQPDAKLGWSTQVEPAVVRTRAQRLAPSLRVLLEAAEKWRMWSLHELPIPRNWVKGRVALLGDAAHPVLPFLAQGAVLALEDAAILAQELSKAPTEPSLALQRYENKRRARALRVQAASRRNGRIYHLGGLMAAARDRVLTSAPPVLLMRQYDWLYGWRAK